jgi:phosphate transport system substrate-binding protein
MKKQIVGLLAVIVVVIVGIAAFAATKQPAGSIQTVTSTTTTTKQSAGSTQTVTSTTTVTTTPTTTTSTTTPITLTGAGSTFVYPMMSAWMSVYEEQEPNVQISYSAVGSGAGISDLSSKLVDFAGTDVPLGAGGSSNIPGVITIPETCGAVTVAYNLPGVSSGLHLTGSVVSDIFDGKVTMWNDPEIENLNPSVALPSQTIIPVHRSDGSGTTFVFTSYLSLSSQYFENEIGAGKTVEWPVGLGEPGNTVVASTVSSTQYSIGYVELAYALEDNMAVAAIENPAGNWILPSLNSTELAVQSAASISLPAGNENWAGVSLLNAPAENAYPIVTFTYLLVYQELDTIPGMTQATATGLTQFLWWVVNSGQQYCEIPALDYVKLPANVVATDENSIQSLTFNGQQILTS